MPETPLEDRSEALLVLATGCKIMRLESRHYEALRDFLDHAPAAAPVAAANLEPVLAICAECQAREKLLRECHLSLQLTSRAIRHWTIGTSDERSRFPRDVTGLLFSLDGLIDRLAALPALSNSTGRAAASEPKQKVGSDGGV